MAQPLNTPRVYTASEYMTLGETEPGYSELVEGRTIVNPSPAPKHDRAANELWLTLRQQLPEHLLCNTDLDVDLELSGPDRPGFVRRPDVVVTRRAEIERVDEEGGAIRASQVVLVVEIVSPSSVRTDSVTKRGEYADAGIPHYWILDITAPVSLLACHLAGDFGYADGGEITGRFVVTEPFPAEIDLDPLHG